MGENRKFVIPEPTRGLRWSVLIDTGADSPDDVFPEHDGPAAAASRQEELQYRSLKVFVADRVS